MSLTSAEGVQDSPIRICSRKRQGHKETARPMARHVKVEPADMLAIGVIIGFK